jgi:hypothetical protein
MANAGLDRRLGEDGEDRLGEPLQPVDDGEKHVLDAPVPERVHDAQPELRALVLLEPECLPSAPMGRSEVIEQRRVSGSS